MQPSKLLLLLSYYLLYYFFHFSLLFTSTIQYNRQLQTHLDKGAKEVNIKHFFLVHNKM